MRKNKILITGSNGFIGKNLIERIKSDFSDNIHILCYNVGNSEAEFYNNLKECDFIFHFAAVHRPTNVQEFTKVNIDFLNRIISYLKEVNNIVPILFTSSVQVELNNEYGKSKKAAEEILINYSKSYGVPIFIYRLLNVFGKYARPNSHSVVANFCYNVINNIPLTINDPNRIVDFYYIDDVIDSFINQINRFISNEVDSKIYFTLGKEKIHRLSIEELANIILNFKYDHILQKEEESSTIKYLLKTYNSYKFKDNINMEPFKDKVLMITGGTGSFGGAVLDRFLHSDIREIRILSRDEKKQDDMRHKYQNSKIKYFIGDVRDKESVKSVLYDVDYVFHAAALKQVPSCEFFPIEAVKTNVIGTDNVLSACIEVGVKKVVCLSTDKAAYPVNAMGTSKAMMEKVFVAKSRTISPSKTLICGTRYGNVMCSRGSIIPLFIDQILSGKPLTVTNPDMTRFIMSLNEAVDLVLFAFNNGNAGDIFVQKADSCTIGDLAIAVKELFHANNEVKIIGIRHGEKMYETLLTNEECANACDMDKFFRVSSDNRDLNYDKYNSVGDYNRNLLTEYNSNNTNLLSIEQIKNKLLSIPFVQEALKTQKSPMIF